MQKSALVASGLLAAAVVVAYAYVLGPLHHWQPSTHPEDWARLGEYVGGLCVPLLLIGLSANAAAVRNQADSQQQRAALEELLREARSLAAIVEQLVAVPASAERCVDAGRKLDLLAAVLSEYVSRGGDSIFLLFYKDRFRAAAERLRDQAVAVGTSEWWLASSEEDESRRWRF